MRPLLLTALVSLALLGCRKEEDPSTIDLDGDGVMADVDCDDTDPDRFQGNDELCNGLDDDCDEEVDEEAVDATTWFADTDGDGYGDAATSLTECEQPVGYVVTDTDCDDADASFHPGAPEYDCTDPNDYNCDGSVGYADADGDGWAACEECDDSNGAVNPNADEVCNELDDDCDGEVDQDAVDAPTWYYDADEDGYGRASTTLDACDQPAGYVDNADDCDDLHGASFPGGTEVCDEHDNDCNGEVDEDSAVDAPTWYEDGDGDSWGDDDTTAVQCEAPDSTWTTRGGDCDDDHAAATPVGTELCDTLDNDCDGTVDESDAVDASAWYEDADGDGWGDADTETTQCYAPASDWLTLSGDCDDDHAASHPGGTEVCDEHDNDCDGDTDESDAVDASTWYADDDGDGYGDESDDTDACDQPSGYVASDTDCDDTDDEVNPAATEVCNEVDDDCDGTVDESDAADATTWYADLDGDGYGGSRLTRTACEAPTGYVDDSTDCDDLHAASYPGGTEVCDEHDNDCDGTVDEDDATDAGTWYADTDGDGYGDATDSEVSCEAPSGYVSDDTDCDDTEATSNPSAWEVCDGADNDCDGTVDESSAIDADTWYLDSDGDGYGDPLYDTEACTEPSGFADNDDDCDDVDDEVNPSATEYCDGIDNDCDGTVDEGDAVDADLWYADDDGDGYGDPDDSEAACSQPSGYVSDDTDCYDTDATTYPGSHETETPGDGIDTDCDGYDGCTDLNCDGWADIAFARYYTGSYASSSPVFLSSAGSFSATADYNLTAYGPWHLDVNDYDGDGYQDIFYADHYYTSYTNSSYVYYGSASGYSSSDRTSLTTYGAYNSDSEDLDGDGYPDLVVCDYYSGSSHSTNSYVYWGSSAGLSTSDRTALPTLGCTDVDIADFDGDGYFDLYFASHTNGSSSTSTTHYLYWGSFSGYSTSDRSTWSTYRGYVSAAGDLDDDGYDDLIDLTHYDGNRDTTSYIWWGSSTGLSTSSRTSFSTSNPRGAEMEDLDGDGIKDLVVINYRSASGSYSINSHIYWGADSWSSSTRTSLPTLGAMDLEVEDLDSDGYPDIVTCNYYTGSTYSTNSYIYWGSSSGYSTSSRTSLPTIGCRRVLAHDLDQDGYSEIIFANYSSGNWSSSWDSYIYWGSSAGYSTSDRTSLGGKGLVTIAVAPGIKSR